MLTWYVINVSANIPVYAVAGSGSPVTFNIPAGVTTQPFTITIIDNNIVECNEVFNVTMVSVTNCGITIGSNRNSEVIITDDDSKHNYCMY